MIGSALSESHGRAYRYRSIQYDGLLQKSGLGFSSPFQYGVLLQKSGSEASPETQRLFGLCPGRRQATISTLGDQN